jgi:hypothetical protein
MIVSTMRAIGLDSNDIDLKNRIKANPKAYSIDYQTYKIINFRNHWFRMIDNSKSKISTIQLYLFISYFFEYFCLKMNIEWLQIINLINDKITRSDTIIFYI